ncbi:MAG: PAS domain S-box protein [Nitrospirae bacterium]|nr:PAS domain S-box protein [Nitrospirota bacterium]
MSLRVKLSLMLSFFLVVVAILAGGSIMIFDKMSGNVSSLKSVGEENKLFNELDRNVAGLMDSAKNWGMTGETRFRRGYEARKEKIKMNLEGLTRLYTDDREIRGLQEDCRTILQLANKIIETRGTAGSSAAVSDIRNMETQGLELIVRIDELQERSVDKVLRAVTQSRDIERKMIYYHVSLIVFSALVSVYLILLIRRAITSPFNELLKATEKIGSGEFSHRITVDRTDEFGKISDGLNKMAEAIEDSTARLRQRLSETELFLEVAKISGTTLDKRPDFTLIAEAIALKLGYDACMIYNYRPDQDVYLLEAINGTASGKVASDIPASGPLVTRVCGTQKPVIIQGPEGLGTDDPGLGNAFGSVLAVPVIRHNSCAGMLVLGSITPGVFPPDIIDVLTILSHTIGSAETNYELYISTRKQLTKLSLLYELTRAVTSVLDLKELLSKTAEGITGMLSSKGCIIRLLEGDKLKIKGGFGLPPGIEDAMELSIGEGIAGWVAGHGEPLLVEDVSKAPEGLYVPKLDLYTVVCVPLKLGGTVIGTLGIYDKINALGEPVPFDGDDLNTAEGFASVAAIAIDKAKIYENEVAREIEATEAKKRLDILFDSVHGGIISVDREDRIISANKYIEDWTSIAIADLIGKTSRDIFHDSIGICPHCASKPTFETGDVNTIMQSRGMNYAELTAYPIRNETGVVTECVVFIQDVTERVLYQEETLSLYREVIQTKEYLESIIDNSADAIVTTDIDGKIISWNEGAEKTFGFSESEAIGAFLPFVPDFLLEKEKEYIEKIKTGEVLKDIETLRKRKDGKIIEVSLTLSPIKDTAGQVIGISGISRDISEKKSVEKELIRRSQELARLFFISSAMRGTLELEKLLRMVLVAVTMGDGMGFNRAILFLVDENRNTLKGAMGVGPASPEEAWKIWDDLSLQRKSMDEIMQEVMSTPLEKDSFLDRLSRGIEVSLDDEGALTQAVLEKKYLNIRDVRSEAISNTLLIQNLGTEAFAVVPLVSRDKVIGLIWVDNYFNKKEITDEDMKFLTSFSNHVASAIENARLFEQVRMTEQQLENIFESMSDMVYFNSPDYIIKSVNKAVCNRMGRPASEIVGRKCYEIFHGSDKPNERCPHHKTVENRKAYIEELDDQYLGGTFLTSSSPIFDLNGEFMGSVHVVRDITDLKDLQSKLAMSEKMAALGEVAAKVAHEIRNPLVSVGGFAKRLEKKLDGNLKEYAGIIVREVSRLENILREILGFVKEVRLSKESVSLNAIVDDIITVMESDTEDKGISIFRDFAPSVEVYVDINRVQEALMNIVSNAIQSLPGPGAIYIKTYTREKYAVVEVRDTGRGIDETHLSSIFNPFFTTKASGTGLGLAITHRIIQEHNGMIEVESEPGQGSVFKVYIPIKEVQA